MKNLWMFGLLGLSCITVRSICMSKTGKRTCLDLARQFYERAQRERYISCSTLHHQTCPCGIHISSSTEASEGLSSKSTQALAHYFRNACRRFPLAKRLMDATHEASINHIAPSCIDRSVCLLTASEGKNKMESVASNQSVLGCCLVISPR